MEEVQEQRKRGAIKLKPIPQPKRPKLTKEELEARPAPQPAKKLSMEQKRKRAKKIQKSRVPHSRIEQSKKAAAAAKKKHDDNKLCYANLKTFHIFGTRQYGPGPTYIPQCLLLAVLEQDRKAVEAEQQLSTERSLIILQGQGAAAAAYMVANPHFNEVWTGDRSPIFHQVSGKGMDIGQGARF